MKKIGIIGLSSILIGLSACTTMEPYPHSLYYYSEDDYYYQPMSDLNMETVRPKAERQPVVINPGYYMTSNAPVRHEKLDQNWIESQSAAGFTIELADDPHAAVVAKKLFSAPKMERSAQIKYQSPNKNMRYKGVYGTYPNQEAAKQALKKLPPELQKGATVKNWNDIKNNAKPVTSTTESREQTDHKPLSKPVIGG